MAIGPVQLLVLGFNHPDFTGEIVDELQKLRDSGTVRVIDALAVYKDARGEIEVQHLGTPAADEAHQPGSVVGALIGLSIDGEDVEIDALAGAEATARVDPLSEDEGWDVVQDIPDDTAAALLLIEHQWVVPLRDAIGCIGGFRISDGWISPLDLAQVGLVTAADAEALHAIESGATGR